MAEVLNVWIGNLGKYTEGKLEGEWVSLPCSKEKLEQVYEKIGITEKDGETFLADFDIPSEVSYLKEYCTEYANISDLNMIAGLIEEYHPNPDAMEAFLNVNSGLSPEKLGNAIVQAEEIPFYGYEFEGIENCSNMTPEEKYGYTVTENNGTYAKLEKIGMENYVNFEAIGRDAQLSGDVDLYENGYYEAAGGGPDLGCYSKEDLLTMSGLSEPDMEKEVQMEENAPRL